jgi:hypothetical protein
MSIWFNGKVLRFLTMGLCCWACSPHHTPIVTPVEPTIVHDEPVVVDSSARVTAPYLVAMLSKTACYGSCPNYQAWVYSNGTVLWCGESHVARLGDFKASASAAWISELFQQVEISNFWQLAPQYPANGKTLADVPFTVTYFRNEKNERRIVDNADAPLILQQLESCFEAKLEALDWVPFSP